MDGMAHSAMNAYSVPRLSDHIRARCGAIRDERAGADAAQRMVHIYRGRVYGTQLSESYDAQPSESSVVGSGPQGFSVEPGAGMTPVPRKR